MSCHEKSSRDRAFSSSSTNLSPFVADQLNDLCCSPDNDRGHWQFERHCLMERVISWKRIGAHFLFWRSSITEVQRSYALTAPVTHLKTLPPEFHCRSRYKMIPWCYPIALSFPKFWAGKHSDLVRKFQILKTFFTTTDIPHSWAGKLVVSINCTWALHWFDHDVQETPRAFSYTFKSKYYQYVY